jgi:hypothetical protein
MTHTILSASVHLRDIRADRVVRMNDLESTPGGNYRLRGSGYAAHPASELRCP